MASLRFIFVLFFFLAVGCLGQKPCTLEQKKACVDTPGTGNRCIPVSHTKDGYNCYCNVGSFEEIKKNNEVMACKPKLDCTKEDEKKCKVYKDSASTGNICIKLNNTYTCDCKKSEYIELLHGETIVGCEPIGGSCSIAQQLDCAVRLGGQATKNKCIIPNPIVPTKHKCECHDERFKPQKEKDGPLIVKCVLTSGGNCTDFQHYSCHSDDPENGNTCSVPDPNKPAEHICECTDLYQKVTNEKGDVVGCEVPECDEDQRKACKTTQDGEPTPNICNVDPDDKTKYVCTCAPHFESIMDESGVVVKCEPVAGCTAVQAERCAINGTDNKCISHEDGGFECECVVPFASQVDENNIVVACELRPMIECNAEQQIRCMLTNPNGVETGNTCDVPNEERPNEAVCTCDGEGYMPGIQADTCELADTAVTCNQEQKMQCILTDPGGKDTGNMCLIPDPANTEEHECTCVDPYEEEKRPGLNVVQSCLKKFGGTGMCTEEQRLFCQTTNKEGTPTFNTCVQPNFEEESRYVCECLDQKYGEIKDNNGDIVNCSRNVCDEPQESDCKVEVDGQYTGNHCAIPNVLESEIHRCICMKPYFEGRGENGISICNRLPHGEFYLKKPPIELTVFEGDTVILDCVTDRGLNVCQWERADQKVRLTLYTNVTTEHKRYSLLGQACDGDCSIIIHSASLTHDNAKWTCIPFLKNTFIPTVSTFLYVVVPPRSPWLEYNDEILQDQAKVYIKFQRMHTKSVEVSCVSRSGYPAVTHSWLREGIPVEPQPATLETKDDRAYTISSRSTVQFILKKSNSTTMECIASSVNNSIYDVATAIFYSTAPTRKVQILYMFEDDWFAPPHGVIILEYPAETLLQCEADGRPEPQYAWQEYVNKQWKPVGFFESYIITTHSRTLRCLAGNNENIQLIPSRAVTIQSKGSGDIPELGTGPENVPTFYRFLREPDNQLIGPGATFDLPCQVNGPVHTCLWHRRELEKKRLGILPDFAYIGQKDDGQCGIQIVDATENSLGGWQCQLVLHDGNVMWSREAIVRGLHFGIRPDEEEEDDGWRFKPQLRINDQVITNRELIVLNPGQSSKLMGDVLAECNAYARTDSGKVLWKLGNIDYKLYASNRFSVPADPPVYLITSKMDFVLSSVLKSLEVPQPILMELGCKIVDRKKLSLVKNEWVLLKDHEIIALLTLEHPTRDVMLFPPGPVTLRSPFEIKVVCRCNGFPPPSVHWQEYLEEDNLWVTIQDKRGASTTLEKPGYYRCTAGNMHNQKRLVSEILSIELDESFHVNVSSSSSSCSLSKMFNYFEDLFVGLLITLLTGISLYCLCF